MRYERSIASLTKGLHPTVGTTHNLLIFLLRLNILKDRSFRTDSIDQFAERWKLRDR